MSENKVFDLTRFMEGFIDEHQEEMDVMRELLVIAEQAHVNGHYNHFRIGDHVYTLDDLMKIQAEEEHEAFLARHRK